MKLNGWQRLWVVVSVLWAAASSSFLSLDEVDTSQTSVIWMAGFIVLPPIGLYVTGMIAGWIIRGFRKH